MHIHHLTITTGHSRRSNRHEIAPQVLADLRGMLASALPPGAQSGRIDLPTVDPPGHWLQLRRHGRCLLCALMRDAVPLVTFGVATHSRCGAVLWRRLVDGAELTPDARHPDPGRAPQEPWCAARLEPGIGHMPGAAHWLGDLERCIAWAWIDTIEGAR